MGWQEIDTIPTDRVVQVETVSDLTLDGTKIAWYADRVAAWERGERIAPVTVDMALLPRRSCNFNCVFCYANMQENKGHLIDGPAITRFLDDAAAIGVKGVSLVSDGESTHSPVFEHTVTYGCRQGLDMALGTNGLVLTPTMLDWLVPSLTYLRFNIAAAEPKRYAEIMGAKEHWLDRVVKNIEHAVKVKEDNSYDTTIGMQMVLMPEFADQILPLSKLAIALGVDYLVIKHCSDDENGTLGVDYAAYEGLRPVLEAAERLSNGRTSIVVKWNKLNAGNVRSYRQCYGPPFIIQLSGTGLVAPCGMFFAEKYKRFHLGNIVTQSFRDIWESERYWEVMAHLASRTFDAQTACGCLCLQHYVNEALDRHQKGEQQILSPGEQGCRRPQHLSFL